jgi:transcription elongation factor Elf1
MEFKIFDCPFCQVEEDDPANGKYKESGCCFCDHSGRIRIGHMDSFFQTEDHYWDMVEHVTQQRRDQFKGSVEFINKVRSGSQMNK